MKRFVILLIMFLFALRVPAAEPVRLVGEGVILQPRVIDEIPVIDGRLDETVWQEAPLIDEPFITNNPVYGQPAEQKTRIWIAYDSQNIYLAFYCHDSDPARIRASVCRRDNLFNDDWIGVDLDTLGNREMTQEIICNPLGMQADLINTVAGGESADPDWVWYSAGRIVNDGYIVEIRLPLRSFKFQNRPDVEINLAFYRYISHSGTNCSWPQIDQKKGYFNSLVPTRLQGLGKQLRLEALPAVTYGSLWDRRTPRDWSAADDAMQVGLGVKYGITSSLEAEITVNPDFSQVESDQFQVEANERYPLFYNEKRPFFMDVSSLFSVAGLNGEGNFWSAVHSRQIVDPAWGGKLSGNFGKTYTGLLIAGDDWPQTTDSQRSGQALYAIARLKRSLRGGNYVGLLYSGRSFDGDGNHVLAADANLRLFGKHSLGMNAMFSFSDDGKDRRENGMAASLLYQYDQKELDLFGLLEYMQDDFRMDTAYYQRSGITKFTAYIGPQFYPVIKSMPWLKRFNPFLYGYYLHDQNSGGDDIFFFPALRFFFTRQANIRFDYRILRENWAGRDFWQRELVSMGEVRPTRWLVLHGQLRYGRRLYYHPSQPFLGRRLSVDLSLDLQPDSRLSQSFEYTYQRFSRLEGAGLVYDLNLIASRTSYQFNRSLFLRALIQYDSYNKRVLSDVLASFTLIPGTVLHLGYGSLHQKRVWNEEMQEWRELADSGHYYQSTQSLFFKASYLYRF